MTVEKKSKLFWYEMLHRPIGIGCQPKGFVATDHSKGNYGLVAYERKLTKKELEEFEMKEWNE